VTIVPGTRVGPYEVLELIGEGGMGRVYRATDTNLKRAVAIKVLPDTVVADADRLARFQREAEVLARLNHPNIAQIHGLEKFEGGTALVMEIVEGPTLADRIAQGPLSIDEVLPIAKEIAAALEAAHEQGIVHRDLKPANIKVRHDGTVKVLDFGLAKALDVNPARAPADQSPTITSPAFTQAGMILGTAAYMSPEQARGKAVDKRADIWAFGAVLYEMLTGRRAFPGADVSDVLASVLAREPDWTQLPAGLSPTLAAYLKRCLEKDPKHRVRDIGDVALALTGAFDSAGHHHASPPAVAMPLWRRVLPIGLAVIVAALATAAVAWSRWPSHEPPRSATRFEYVLPEGQQLPTTQRPVIAVSPDGRSFVYQERSGLFLRSMGELEARLIPGTQDARVSPFFSPDGKWLAYFTTGGVFAPGPGLLKKVLVSGGAAITICEVKSFPNGQSWAPDNTILFGQAEGIMRVSANSGSPELLVPAAAGEELFGPELLPGNAVLFIVTKEQGPARWDHAQVVAQSLATGHRTVVVQRGYDAHYLATGHLTYALDNDVYAVAFDATRLTASGSAVPVVQGVQRPVGLIAAALNLVVSGDGTLVYLAAQNSSRALFWLDRQGRAVSVTTIPAGRYSDVRLSPDGGRVLLTLDGDIWIYDLASGRSSRLTRDGTSQMGVWDPTGARIAYSSARGGNLEAWVESADGGGQPRQLTSLGGVVHVDSWSPDGRLLSIHHHDRLGRTAIDLVSIDQAGAKSQPFLGGAFNEEGAAFSSDGRYVAYLSTESGQREIYVRQYPGAGGQATASVGGGMEAVWAGRGAEIFYRSLSGDRMFAVPVTSGPTLKVGTPVQLFQGRYYVAPTGSPRPQYDVSADGQRFLMLAPTTGTDASLARPRIIVVENWFEELKRLVPKN
jgi:eukaryotic-like serine/threonine-protein kinase